MDPESSFYDFPEQRHWQQIQSDQSQKREVDAMVKTIAEAIMEEGELNHARKAITRHGAKLFGPANVEIESAINLITDLKQLDRMLDHINFAKSWSEVLETE